jgi:hypothetical protein
MSRKSETKTVVVHRSALHRHHRTRDTVSANKTRTSTIDGHSRWEDDIVSHICHSCFHNRSLVTSNLSSDLFEKDCPLSQSSLFRNSTVSMRHSLCVERTIPPVERWWVLPSRHRIGFHTRSSSTGSPFRTSNLRFRSRVVPNNSVFTRIRELFPLTTVEESVLRTEMTNLESQEEDTPSLPRENGTEK